MTDETLSEDEKLLLMAAAVQGLDSGTDLGFANTSRVVDQVLRWLGLNDEQIRSGWRQDGDGPIHDRVYKALIRMTYQLPHRPQERPGKPLFLGGGNWGVPGDPSRPACWPHFNSCSLTKRGEKLAKELLAQHPDYQVAKPQKPSRFSAVECLGEAGGARMTDRQRKLLGLVEEAFRSVELGDGVGLHEADVIDSYGTFEERRAARVKDEKHDWHNLLADPDFTGTFGIGLGYFEAAGLRFHLPAYLTLAVADPRGENFLVLSAISFTPWSIFLNRTGTCSRRSVARNGHVFEKC